jgi:hypothetical protein
LKSESLANLEIDERSGYGVPDLVRMFLLITKRPAGRTSLIKKLHLKEATVKTMLKFLKNNGLVEQGTRGAYPTGKGLSLFSPCRAFVDIKDVNVPEFSEKPAVALVVKNAAKRVRAGIEQRDEGVRFGARIITLLKKNGRLSLAGVPGCRPAYMGRLQAQLRIGADDVVIVSAADKRLDAERGIVAAGLTIV